MKTRVYIVDSHALIRHGLIALMAVEPDLVACGEAENGSSALNGIMRLEPEVVTVEICLQGNSGLELIKSIKAFNRKIGILVISMYPENDYALRGLKAGARGFISKQASNSRVLDAIRRVRDHQLYVSGDIQARMLGRIAGGDTERRSPVDSLSDRELEIGNLIGTGLHTGEIALRLHVSVKTVETHRNHLKGKLGLANTAQLQHFWIRWVDRTNAATEPMVAAREHSEQFQAAGR